MNFFLKYFRFYLIIVIAETFFSPETEAQNTTCIDNNFGTIVVSPDLELTGAGLNIDTIEFWNAADITESLMFVTAKDNSLVEVWKYPFGTNDEQTPLTHSTLYPDNAEVNGVQVDQETDLLYVSVGSPNSYVCVFTLPDLEFVTNFGSNGNSYHSEPNLTLLNLPNGGKNLYVSANDIVYIHDVSDVASQNFGNLVGSFNPIKGLETLQADNYYKNLIIPDEKNTTGIYAYYPNGTDYPSTGESNFGTNTIQGDGEGILLYNCSAGSSDQGDGFFVVADQITTVSEFEFFDRETWEHFGNMKVTGVSNTDGVASFPYSIPNYPMGVFAAIDNDKTTVLVSWEKIFDAIAASGGLPVELTSFSASVKNSAVILNWETVTEVNNYGFDIERSTNNSNWMAIGFVEGHGNSNSPKYYNFSDTDIVQSSKYHYRLKQIDNDGTFEYSDVISVIVGIPVLFALSQNYPNPFNPETIIKFSIPQLASTYTARTTLVIYDILGNVVATLMDENKPAGNYEVKFSANAGGRELSSGIYFYKLHVAEFVETKKMVMLK
ncbi:MAG: T9SS type A sorting domain-containing protein [Bacteroidetes bacterium]|nr:T9SS type A sorting domain-containing protein [Bacteroidota bacterium]